MNNLNATIFILLLSAIGLQEKLPSFSSRDHKEMEDSHTHHCLLDHRALFQVDSTMEQMFSTIPEQDYPYYFASYPNYKSDGFDFPVGKPNAYNYYKAQNFGDNRHLGEDWNGRGGGNSDLGDPVYSASNGLVIFAKDVCCGWGKTVRVLHHVPDNPKYPYIETVYAHLDDMSVTPGSLVQRGQKIGTIGTGGGIYSAHLHFEMRDLANMSLGPGYSDNTAGYLSPTDYIRRHRSF